MAFKMKGSPMYRNYGIGSPAKKTTEDPPSREEIAEMNKKGLTWHMGGWIKTPKGPGTPVEGSFKPSGDTQEERDANQAIYDAQQKRKAEKSESPVKKTKADRIRGRKKGTVKNVTERLDEGDYKSARLERRGNVAASKGKQDKAKRLRRKADESNQKFFKDQVQRRGEK